MANDKVENKIGKQDAGQLDRWHRNAASEQEVRSSAKARVGSGALPGNQNSLRHGIYADRFLSPEERPLFETIIGQLYQDFVFNKSSDFMQVELVAVYFLKLGRAQESGDWDAAEKLDRMIRCHLKDLKATKIAREGEASRGPETTPAEWATALLEKLAESQKKTGQEVGQEKENAEIMSDNTRAIQKRERQSRGFTAFQFAGMSDKTCSLTLRKPQEWEISVNRFFPSPMMLSSDDLIMLRNCVQARHCESTVTQYCHCLLGAWNENAVPKDRRIPGPEDRSQSFNGVFEHSVHKVGVDLGGRQVAMPEGSLDNQDIAGSAVEVGGERVPQCMRSKLLLDPRCLEPVFEPPRDLTLTKACPAVGEEQRPAFPVALTAAFFQVTA